MIGASKILTVSYGTFSCTLEGFDDPFNTMRAIAEYFRDLAAEDRYFGAEPPTPDAAMLHRIAEREINRRVEANVQENGVILRAGDAEPARMQAGTAAPMTGFAPMAVASASPILAEADAAAADSVAAQLQRLREAQNQSQTIEAPQVLADIGADAEDIDLPASEPARAWQADTIASVMAELAEPLPALDAALEAPALMTEPQAMPDDAFDAAATPGWPVVDDVAAVDFDDADAAIVAAAEMGEPAAEATEAPAEQIEEAFDDYALANLADRLNVEASDPDMATDATPVAADAVAASPDEDILRATLGAMIDPEAEDEPEDELLSAPADAATTSVMDVSDLVSASMADAPAQAWADDAQPAAPADHSETPETASAEAAPVAEFHGPAPQADAEIVANPAAEAQDDAPSDAETDARNIEKLQRARARVIKIRRIDASAAPISPAAAAAPAEIPAVAAAAAAEAAADVRGAMAADLAADTAMAEPAPTALSAEAEAELMRELADLEADLAPAAAQAADDAAPSQPGPAPAAADPQKTAAPSPADDAVNRLISQTNAAMEGPENKRRLAAIAHLKAAVAATFADRKANAAPAQPGPAERMDPYRDDLERVVRPRRPALIAPSAENTTPAPARPQIDTRPAPLVLVSEQRIDRPAAPRAPVNPVRPRRITSEFLAPPARTDTLAGAAQAAEDDDDIGLTEDDVNNIFADPNQPFAEFAERLGAVTMTDLMEAAAAYCALQLGRDQFTRPLLLQQIAGLPQGDDFNREDCLRGFGTLLRDGRIEKIKRGQFKLSGQSRYLAEGKRLAG